MKNIKCSDCAEYQNEWCKKIVDSPHQDILRDCQYWHERKDMVEVVRCRDCKHNPAKEWFGCPMSHLSAEQRPEDAWCWKGERE